jgi:hypothetical protein
MFDGAGAWGSASFLVASLTPPRYRISPSSSSSISVWTPLKMLWLSSDQSVRRIVQESKTDDAPFQVTATAKAILLMIEAEEKKSQFQTESMRDLRIAVEALKGDCTGYKTLLESILMTHDKRPLDKLCGRYSDSFICLLQFIDSVFISKFRRKGCVADPQLGTCSRKAASGAKSTPINILSDLA